jgi:hypothetical protein
MKSMEAMEMNLLPKSEVLIWKLLLTGEEPTKSQVKPRHSAKELKQLEEMGLIKFKTVVEKGRRVTRVVLTDKAWDWASTTPPEAAVVLQKALATLVDYAQRENVPLARILGLRPSSANRPSLGGAASAPAKQTQPWEVSEEEVDPDFLEKVFRTCEAMGGRYFLVYLNELRKKFPDVPRWLLDQALLTLHHQAKIVLMNLDDPLSVTPEIEAAAIDLYGYKKHVLRVRN